MSKPDRDHSASRRVPAFYEQGAGPEERYPSLHESQILQNLQWHERRAQRVLAHVERVRSHLRRYSRRTPGTATQGRRRAAWCVEMKLRFESLTAAGKFVSRPPSNILQAIHSHNRCGNYHWEYFDPTRHLQASIDSPPGSTVDMPQAPFAAPLQLLRSRAG
jgi:hypothetical protein